MEREQYPRFRRKHPIPVGAGDVVIMMITGAIDINKFVVEQGRSNHPKAHFVHFNRYSTVYNPEASEICRYPIAV